MPVAAQRSDVEDLLGVDLTTSADRVDNLIDRAEGIVLADLPGFTLGNFDDETVTLTATGGEFLELPFYPVRSVASVTVDGTLLDATEWELVGVLGRLRRRYTGVSSPHLSDGSTRRWPDRGVDITVVYSYGYVLGELAGPARCIRDVVAELAAGRIVNPQQVAQESLGDRSVSFGAGGANGDGLTAEHRHRLRHWRRNRLASARVRS